MNYRKGSLLIKILREISSFRNKKFDVVNFSPRKIIIVQKAGLGDFLMLLPTLLTISKSRKDIKLNILVTSEVYPLAKRYGIFNSVRILETDSYSIYRRIKSLLREILIDLRKPYDIIFQPCSGANVVTYLLLTFSRAKIKVGFDYNEGYNFFDISLHYNSSIKDVRQNAMILNYLGISVKQLIEPKIPIFPNESEVARRMIEKEKKRLWGETSAKIKMVGIYPHTMEPHTEISRAWGIENFASFVDYLHNEIKDIFFIFFGSASDRKYCEEIVNKTETQPKAFILTGTVSIFESCAISKYCDIVIGIDGGFMHFINIMKIPSIVLWGQTSYKNHGYDNDYTTNLMNSIDVAYLSSISIKKIFKDLS